MKVTIKVIIKESNWKSSIKKELERRDLFKYINTLKETYPNIHIFLLKNYEE